MIANICGMDQSLLARTFRAVALAEALTWTGLLIGMFVKYVPENGTETGVQLFGPLHGTLFLLYVAVALLTARRFRWSPQVTLIALVAAIPPLATAFFDMWVQRRGLLERTA